MTPRIIAGLMMIPVVHVAGYHNVPRHEENDCPRPPRDELMRILSLEGKDVQTKFDVASWGEKIMKDQGPHYWFKKDGSSSTGKELDEIHTALKKKEYTKARSKLNFLLWHLAAYKKWMEQMNSKNVTELVNWINRNNSLIKSRFKDLRQKIEKIGLEQLWKDWNPNVEEKTDVIFSGTIKTGSSSRSWRYTPPSTPSNGEDREVNVDQTESGGDAPPQAQAQQVNTLKPIYPPTPPASTPDIQVLPPPTTSTVVETPSEPHPKQPTVEEKKRNLPPVNRKKLESNVSVGEPSQKPGNGHQQETALTVKDSKPQFKKLVDEVGAVYGLNLEPKTKLPESQTSVSEDPAPVNDREQSSGDHGSGSESGDWFRNLFIGVIMCLLLYVGVPMIQRAISPVKPKSACCLW